MNNDPKKIVYSEPDDYFPKEIREKYFGDKDSVKDGTPTEKPSDNKETKRKDE